MLEQNCTLFEARCLVTSVDPEFRSADRVTDPNERRKENKAVGKHRKARHCFSFTNMAKAGGVHAFGEWTGCCHSACTSKRALGGPVWLNLIHKMILQIPNPNVSKCAKRMQCADKVSGASQGVLHLLCLALSRAQERATGEECDDIKISTLCACKIL